ncbi:MAG TPA: HAD family hydrolase [Anaerolineae bacterium]|nr:HAD family hydrolase [Anaerolineae bacterium]
MPLRTVLFDLDGTLLDNDMDVFITHFLRRFAPHVAHRVGPEQFVQTWLHALQFLLHNSDQTLTNQEVFDLNFYPRLGVLRDELLPSVEAFYATSYRSLRSLVRPRPGARETVQAMLDAGLSVVVATNPIFPQVAVDQRLEWAGIADLPLALITTSENMHAAKPSLQYYHEILDRIACAPAESLMIGDDFINDIQPANRLGLRTYWVNTSTTTPPNFDPRARGELHHFYTWLVAAGLLSEPQ